MISVTCLCLLVSFVFTFGPERANGSTKVDAYKVRNAGSCFNCNKDAVSRYVKFG